MKCQKCGNEYDYLAQTEAGMGYIKCPGCGVKTDQTGKTYEEAAPAATPEVKQESSFFTDLVKNRRTYQDNTGK